MNFTTLVVDGRVVKFIIFFDGVKHLNFVDDGRNKYLAKVIS